MAVWVVRGGSEGEYEEEALEKDVVAIGFDPIDLTDIQTRDELKDSYQQRYPEATSNQIGNWAGQLWTFKDQIRIGDLLVMPRKKVWELVAVGEVSGGYEYHPESPFSHRRAVKWINKEVHRDSLDQGFLRSMSSDLTVFMPQRQNNAEAERRLRAIAQSPDPWSPANIAALAEELLWESQQLQEIIDDLQEKRQVIFYGPPGTGKTYVAKRIAEHCRDHVGDFEIVQFHPSYSYGDFVQGFRPSLQSGQPGFELVDGPLRRIAEQARANPDAPFILVIDELNRGNVAKVFGELYFLLEYRNEKVRLQYGRDDQGFSLPPNLWFICTMNTADRSIALMDAALRRRFYFAPFFPNQPPIEGLLRRWLDKHGHDALAADIVDAANEKLERDMGIGPSYFMGDGQTLDETRVRRIWNRAVIPYVEEQCFGDNAKLQEFDFDRLNRVEPNEDTADGVEPEQQADNANADPEGI